ncbi:hypothetical protein HAX54_010289 [Datura stramonium]|uniref:Uncharacterized protein n=1 Tax=Datura stramonium TaxID=4076 RepID=A0ABS8THU0_DATST|nr:hypothetical protein [Datura stramonium]
MGAWPRVAITPEAINSLYWAEPIKPNSTFHRKVDGKENQFQWVAYISAMGQPQWAISGGLIHHRDLKFEARMWLDLVCARLIPSQNTTEVPIKFEIPIAYIMDHVHINMERSAQINSKEGPSNRTHHYHILALDAPTMKRAKGIEKRTQPPPSMPSSTPEGQLQIVKLAKAIPSMIHQGIKKAMQPARDKLRGLCTTVDVLENEVITLRKDVATLTRHPLASNPNPPEPAAVTSQPKAPKIPPDDWWVGV